MCKFYCFHETAEHIAFCAFVYRDEASDSVPASVQYKLSQNPDVPRPTYDQSAAVDDDSSTTSDSEQTSSTQLEGLFNVYCKFLL